MATYTQWRTAFDKGDTRRVTFVCGEQRILVEEVVDATRTRVGATDVDSIGVTVGEEPERVVWAAASQYPMQPGAPRLVVVRDAHRIRDWTPLTGWVGAGRRLPGVHLLFVSTDDDLPQVNRKPAPFLELIRPPRGHLVRCATPNPDDAVAWVRRRAPLDDAAARYLLTRVGGNLTQAAGVCTKLAVFGATAGRTAIDALVRQFPADTFVDSLLDNRKSDALLALPGLTDTERLRTIGVLDQRLDLLATLGQHLRNGQALRDFHGAAPFLARRYASIANQYDRARCAYSRRVLAVVDDALRSGARTGTFEVLVALW